MFFNAIGDCRKSTRPLVLKAQDYHGVQAYQSLLDAEINDICLEIALCGNAPNLAHPLEERLIRKINALTRNAIDKGKLVAYARNVTKIALLFFSFTRK